MLRTTPNLTTSIIVVAVALLLGGNSSAQYNTSLFGGGRCFNGYNAWVSLPQKSLDHLQAGTVEVWVKFANLNSPSPNEGEQFIVTRSKYEAGYFVGDLRLGKERTTAGANANKFYFSLDNGNTRLYSQTVAQPDTWYHVAGAWNGSQWFVFINGVAENAISNTDTLSADVHMKVLLGKIEGHTVATWGLLHGWLDEVRFSDKCRTVFELCLGEPCAVDANTIGLWHLDNGQTLDASSNQYDGFSIGDGCPTTTVAIIAPTSLQQTLSVYLEQFITDVTTFNPGLDIDIHWWPGSSATELRSLLRGLWETQNIQGAWLLGDLPVPLWRYQWGEITELPIYYEEFDGTFDDSDHDGYLDHNTWGLNNGPEIWVAWLRPETYFPSFFAKCHEYYTGGLILPLNSLIYTAKDWDDVSVLTSHLSGLYGSSIDVVGGSHVPVAGAPYLDALTQGYSFITLYTHSSSTFHQFDQPPVQNVFTTDLAGRKGAYFEILFACHAADFIEHPTDNFSIAYTFNQTHSFALLGATRSIGTEEQQYIIDPLVAGDMVGTAFQKYLIKMYDSVKIWNRWPAEINRWAWDFTLFGNPFICLRPCASFAWSPAETVWPVGSTQTIRWKTTGEVSPLAIEINRNFPSGAWESLATNVSSSTGFWTWPVVDGSSTSHARVRILPEPPAGGDTLAFDLRVVCCVGSTGNVDCDPANGVDISDLSALIDNLYISFAALCCVESANIDGDTEAGIDISDLSALIDYLYISFTPPAACR